MVTEQDVVDGLTRYYRELDQSISARPPRWEPAQYPGSRAASWRMQLLATAALLFLLVGAGLLFYQARLLNRSTPVTTPSPKAARYQAMMRADVQRMYFFSEPLHCYSVQDTGCPAALAVLTTAGRRWLDDLNGYPPPPVFSVVGEELRKHVAAAVTDFQKAALAVQAGDDQGLTVALVAGNDEMTIDRQLATDIGYARLVTATAYRQTVGTYQLDLLSCSGIDGETSVADPPLLTCESRLTQAASVCFGDAQCLPSAITMRLDIERIQGLLVSVFPPPSLAAIDIRLQHELASAHTALDEMITVLNSPSTTTTRDQFGTAQQALTPSVSAFISDASQVSSRTH